MPDGPPSKRRNLRMNSKVGQYNIPDSGQAIWDWHARDHVEAAGEALRLELVKGSGKTVRKYSARSAVQVAAQQPPSARVGAPPKVGYGGWVARSNGGTVNNTSSPPAKVERQSKSRGSSAGGVEFLNHNKNQAKSWVSKIFAPRAGLREGAADADRIGAGKIGSQGLRTLLSNYGANKNFSDSLVGASASRMKAVKNFVNKPGGWMNRFAVVWVAQEAGKAMAEWRGWDKVSWKMTDAQATATLGKHKPVDPLQFVLGKGISTGLQIASAGTDFFLGLGASAGIITGSEGARTASYVDDVIKWFGSGGRGPSPNELISNVNKNFEREVDKARAKAKAAAEARFYEMIDHNIDRMKDVLAMRGVGNRNEIRSAYARSNQDRLGAMVGAGMLDVDPVEIRARMMNRESIENKR